MKGSKKAGRLFSHEPVHLGDRYFGMLAVFLDLEFYMVRCSLKSSTRWDKNIFGVERNRITNRRKTRKNRYFFTWIFHGFWSSRPYSYKPQQQIYFIIGYFSYRGSGPIKWNLNGLNSASRFRENAKIWYVTKITWWLWGWKKLV